jgi:lactoylglutathione lyase
MQIAYTIIYVHDLPTMTNFYHHTLGLPIAEQNARFVAFSGPGAPLALETGGPTPDGPRTKDRNPTLVQFAVTDIAATIAELDTHNIPIEGDIRRGPFGTLAFFRDPEGNRLAILQPPQQ